ncbi:hypothetical protein EDD18DRAFT_1192473 [Armillaria luteobubalina]|uniref:Uncharacterized protein n=1 Tax=Armillaria luteobubalina TaxID=153913 RepID=A0AA39PMD3_9AGAR|nr:hypothetical protein EDD18DRAFT_1192473 [Armillaria luteobubalina]
MRTGRWSRRSAPARCARCSRIPRGKAVGACVRGLIRCRCPHVRESTRSTAVATAKCVARPPADPCSPTQWARTNPPTKAAGYHNPGWPGCCRPPAPSEHRLIQPADWRSVSIVHHIPIPPDIKATLDGLRPAVPRAPTKPAPDRKPSPPTPKSPAMPPRSPAMPIPPKPRGSPKQGTASLSNSLSRSTPPADKPGTPPSNTSSPARKAIDLDGATTPRRNSSATRPPPAAVKPANRSPPSQPLERRRTLVPSPTSKPVLPPPRPKKDEETASNGSGSSGSLSDSTVTSDGGFTDYLSDESEAELQRQAEARAALVAQNQAEELEFKAARLQLTHVDLRPPKSWDATNPVPSAPSRSSVSSGGSN